MKLFLRQNEKAHFDVSAGKDFLRLSAQRFLVLLPSNHSPKNHDSLVTYERYLVVQLNLLMANAAPCI